MAARPTRTLEVIETQSLTPNMLRLVLGGEQLRGFPEQQESGYIKLQFPQPENEQDNQRGLKKLLARNKPQVRSYTIRAFDPQALTLTLDFVAHGDNGPASAWAMQAKPGDSINISGPGAKKLVDMQADWFFLAADMSALPALSCNLERLPSTAKGYAVIEIINSADKIHIKTPAGVEVFWVVNPNPENTDPESKCGAWVEQVLSLPWLAGNPAVWVAGEFDSMRKLRAYFKQQRKVPRGDIYASSYWKIGVTDEGNKAAKRLDLVTF